MTEPATRRFQGTDGIALVGDIYRRKDTARPVVLLLHGGGQNRHAWARTATAIHAAGHTVVAYDCRGHGDSDWDPKARYDMEHFAYDLLAVREEVCGINPAIVVGASMGGMAILTAHLLAPARLWAGVVLVDVTPRLELSGARRVMEFMATHPRGFASLEDAADVIAAYNPHRRRPDTLDGLAKVLRRTGDGRWCWRWDPAFMSSKVDAMRADPDQRSQRLEQLTGKLLTGASRITAPTLLIRGAMSDLVSPETVTEFLDIVPHATAIDISDTGHMVAGDNNDAFSAAVVEFLRNIGPTRHTAETTH